jgi:hypothetical protein
MKKKTRNLAAPFLILFVFLILGGVAIKRMAGHPEFVIFFHLPAAVFLVLAGIHLKNHRRHEYDAEIAAVRRQWGGEDPTDTTGDIKPVTAAPRALARPDRTGPGRAAESTAGDVHLESRPNLEKV